MGRRKTHEQFVSELALVNPNVEVLGVYATSACRILVRCDKCGHEWSPTASSLLSGHGCPDCAKKKNGERRRKSHEQFVTELAGVNPTIEVVGRYTNSASPIDVRCKRCGCEWSPIARTIVNAGQGCPICGRIIAAAKHRKTQAAFVEEMREVNPDIEIVSKYQDNKTKVSCRCKICGNEWEAAPSNLLQGVGCPRCAKTGTSFMEQFLCVFFKGLIGEDRVVSRDKSAIGRELDIFFPSYMLAVEIGSWYWHRDRLESDVDKESKCAAKGIKLITIYDCYPGYADSAIPKGSMLFPLPLAEEEGHVHLRELALNIAAQMGIQDVGNPDWNQIEIEAAKRTRPRTTEEFVAEMAMVNPEVEILGDYVSTRVKLECRCKNCGHTWFVAPHQLLIGQGCPPCGHRKAVEKAAEKHRKTPQQYRDEFDAANPTKTLLSEYTGSLRQVKVRCNICGHVWSPRSESVLRGTGCPVCVNEGKRKAHDAFSEELMAVNPNIEILGRYEKCSKPIAVKCKKCGHIWQPRPSKLLAGRGCPKCAGKMKMAVRCVETGEVFESYSAAAASVGLSTGDGISAVCRGKQKKAAGYRWEYATDG